MDHHIGLIQNLIDHIESDLTQPLKVTELAHSSGMSGWQFQRVFRAFVGDSLGNYIRHRRLTKSIEQLQNSDKRILDIAIEYQFSSQEAYARAFKQYFGLTPKQIRQQDTKVNTRKKPQLTKELIKHIYSDVVQEPQIVKRPEMKLVGFETMIPSFIENYHNYDELVLPVWQKLICEKSVIKNKKDGYAIGLAKSLSLTNEEETLCYLAAYEVDAFEDVPENMKTYTVPERTYAVFTNKGTGNKTTYTVNYIYGIWLPQVQYERAEGDDFELFDSRYQVLNENSESDYYLPIKA